MERLTASRLFATINRLSIGLAFDDRAAACLPDPALRLAAVQTQTDTDQSLQDAKRVVMAGIILKVWLLPQISCPLQ